MVIVYYGQDKETGKGYVDAGYTDYNGTDFEGSTQEFNSKDEAIAYAKDIKKYYKDDNDGLTPKVQEYTENDDYDDYDD